MVTMLQAVFGDSKRLGVCFEFHRNDEIPIVPEVTKTALQQMSRTADGLLFGTKNHGTLDVAVVHAIRH
jgi:hypothetical protein